MVKNYWLKCIQLKDLNKVLSEKIKKFLGQVWTLDLKNTITKIIVQFVADSKIDDRYVSFSVVLEKSITSDIFRGVRIVV